MHLFIFTPRALTFNALKIQILVYSLRKKEFMYVVSIAINLLSEKVGMAGFTFAKFDIDKTLETMQRADVHYLCIKDFHLPLNST